MCAAVVLARAAVTFNHAICTLALIACQGQRLDGCLAVSAVLVPVFNLTAALHIPGFVDKVNGGKFLAVLMIMGTIAGFTPAHLVMNWVLATPFFM